eukprot:11584120-Ditylum_brightwellii.AAC.1
MSESEKYASLKVSDDRNGLPCAHTGHVVRKHYNGWDGFTMYDVLIFGGVSKCMHLPKYPWGKKKRR